MKKNEIGVFLSSMAIPDPLEAVRKARELELDVVQIGALPDEFYQDDGTEKLRQCLQENGLRASAVCAVYTGEDYSNMAAVAKTVGLTNPEMLQERMAHTKRCADLADKLGARGSRTRRSNSAAADRPAVRKTRHDPARPARTRSAGPDAGNSRFR